MYYSQLDDDEREKREIYMGSSGHPVYYKLTADIDMKGKRCTTIGDLLKQCKAYINFDGDGHTIKNVVMPYDGKSYSYNGIFGLLFDSEIKNVTFENYFIGSEGDRLGLVGFIRNSKLDNVHVINGMVAGCDYIGGLVGGAGWNENKFISSPGSTCYIVNCSFEGEVHNRNSKDDAYFGGLVGYMKGVNMYIMSSLFRGRLTASNNKYNGRGGLVGQLDSDADVYIDACMIMGNPGSSSGSYYCPLEEDYESLASSKNGWAVANVSSSSSKVHLMSPIYICKNRGYSKDNGKVPVACAGSYGSKSNNVFYYNVPGSAYTGLSDGGASKIVTITDGYADSFTANYGNEGYIYNQYKHYFSVATNGKIVIDKEKPTCV
ncbi:MAG: hypothetical protein HUJ83_11195, partial [Veillonella sp.]|nr:hypothetical protein [Veillonella sp.]